jgi:hypothetical protein
MDTNSLFGRRRAPETGIAEPAAYCLPPAIRCKTGNATRLALSGYSRSVLTSSMLRTRRLRSHLASFQVWSPVSQTAPDEHRAPTAPGGCPARRSRPTRCAAAPACSPRGTDTAPAAAERAKDLEADAAPRAHAPPLHDGGRARAGGMRGVEPTAVGQAPGGRESVPAGDTRRPAPPDDTPAPAGGVPTRRRRRRFRAGRTPTRTGPRRTAG